MPSAVWPGMRVLLRSVCVVVIAVQNRFALLVDKVIIAVSDNPWFSHCVV